MLWLLLHIVALALLLYCMFYANWLPRSLVPLACLFGEKTWFDSPRRRVQRCRCCRLALEDENSVEDFPVKGLEKYTVLYHLDHSVRVLLF